MSSKQVSKGVDCPPERDIIWRIRVPKAIFDETDLHVGICVLIFVESGEWNGEFTYGTPIDMLQHGNSQDTSLKNAQV